MSKMQFEGTLPVSSSTSVAFVPGEGRMVTFGIVPILVTPVSVDALVYVDLVDPTGNGVQVNKAVLDAAALTLAGTSPAGYSLDFHVPAGFKVQVSIGAGSTDPLRYTGYIS